MIKSVADLVVVAAVSTGVSAPAPKVPEKQYNVPAIVQTQLPEENPVVETPPVETTQEVPTETPPTDTEEISTELPSTDTEETLPEDTTEEKPQPGIVLPSKAEPSLFEAPPKPEPPKPAKPVEINYDFDIASYTTRYSGAESLNRNYNMRLASDSINGLVMQPGDSFSYNDIVLEKSHNGKDYKEAGIYSNGKVSTGIGGGICQISSTLYQAALYSGMEITQRRNHSLKVGYMEAGRDATASWGSIDFKFKNPLDVPVKIESVMKNGVIKIRFLAPKDPKVGNIKVTVTSKDGKYYLSRTRENGVVDYTATSRYLN